MPKSIRAEILRTAGLVRPCAIGLVEEEDRDRGILDPGHRVTCPPPWIGLESGVPVMFRYQVTWCRHPTSPVQLFRVSSQLKKEAEDIFWKENRFYITCTPAAPSVLTRIAGLGRITQLLLNAQSIVSNSAYAKDPQPWKVPQQIFDDVCRVLAQRLRPRVTLLNVHFTVGTPEQMQEIFIKPLMLAKLPQLSGIRFCECRPRLRATDSKDSWDELVDLFESSAKILTREEKARNAEFRLARLPVELQSEVLSHTSLVCQSVKDRAVGRDIEIMGLHTQRLYEPVQAFGIDCDECRESLYSSLCGCRVKDTLIDSNGIYGGEGALVQKEARRLFFGQNSFHMSGSLSVCMKNLTSIDSQNWKWMRDVTIDFWQDEEGEEAFDMADLIRALEDRLVHPCVTIKLHLRYQKHLVSYSVPFAFAWRHSIWPNTTEDEIDCVIRDTMIQSKLRTVEFLREKCAHGGSGRCPMKRVYVSNG